MAAGRLVRPFDLALSDAFAYFIVCPHATAERPKIVAFREWIMAEAKAYMEGESCVIMGADKNKAGNG
jgi:LysR family glycine cleavage system transcriptional activator